MKAGDRIETPLGPAIVVEIQWRGRLLFGRSRHDARVLVVFPDEQYRIYHAGQVWPYTPAITETPDPDPQPDDGDDGEE